MTPVYQTRHDNCVAACVASILDVSITDVPDFTPETWGEELAEWLIERGWSLLNLRFDDGCDQRMPLGYSMAAIPAGPPFPEHYNHCVVCKDGKIVWDPKRGDMPGDRRASEYTLLYPQEPGRYLSYNPDSNYLSGRVCSR
jgi:hypothetical protein